MSLAHHDKRKKSFLDLVKLTVQLNPKTTFALKITTKKDFKNLIRNAIGNLSVTDKNWFDAELKVSI
jgi:hypothetical protein